MHLVRHARGVMVGWMPGDIDELHARPHQRPAPAGPGRQELAELHHATGLGESGQEAVGRAPLPAVGLVLKTWSRPLDSSWVRS